MSSRELLQDILTFEPLHSPPHEKLFLSTLLFRISAKLLPWREDIEVNVSPYFFPSPPCPSSPSSDSPESLMPRCPYALQRPCQTLTPSHHCASSKWPQAEGVKASYPKRVKLRDLGAYSEESEMLVGMLLPFGPSLQLQKDIGARKRGETRLMSCLLLGHGFKPISEQY